MSDFESNLKAVEELLHHKTGNYLSDLQRAILFTALTGSRKTYEDIAEEYNYSSKYVKQHIAPKLWQLLSQVLGQKITKANLKAALEHQVNFPEKFAQTSFPGSSSVSGSISSVQSTLKAEKGNILLVDDQPENLKLLSDLLEEQGYEVRQAMNGGIALQAIALTPPDLILLDIHMPELDGYTVCQTLKTNPKTEDIPVIFVSALDEAWDKVKAFSVGGSDYITKPFKVVEVLARVENQLTVRHLQQALKEKDRQLQEALRKLEAFTDQSE
ncbi:MAG: response regulator [Leptolyngbya sp. SIO1D8]|nr:response regulator [Leptolyngbya sp. SIO1D8]